ncbi:MAG: signal peptidase [Sphingomonadales bacterium]|jgi:signal peptidase I|nr:signal peptidase [Sphingomonadales bacterium]
MAARVAKRRAEKTGGLAETTRFLVLLFFLAAFVRTFVVAPFMIPSGSMLPGLEMGDYLFAAKWPYGFSRYAFPFGLARFHGRLLGAEPRRGDVVVFRYPGSDEDYVKRLIGLPGDRVQMRRGQLILNGHAVPKVRIADFLMERTPNSPCRFVGSYRPAPVAERGHVYCRYPRYRETLPGGRSYEVLDQIEGIGDETPVYTIPAAHYFMMGDNRDDSADSRFPLAEQGVGMLPRDNLIGRPLILFFSTDGSASWLKPWTWFTAARWDRIGRTS